uniref:Uncharacterized protein n=1 Tax=Panstrongylus megistus TaxID=65343 RepID=A0A069DNN6_9HEMI
MPRHLISDAHEWINEIPSFPIYLWRRYVATPSPVLSWERNQLLALQVGDIQHLPIPLPFSFPPCRVACKLS